MTDAISIRPAPPADWDEIARVFSASLRSMAFLPQLYSEEEEHWFITNIIARDCTVSVAEMDGTIVGFLALEGHDIWNLKIRLLHVGPDHFGQGAGTALLRDVTDRESGPFHLWCFQANDGARRFYERHGFQAAEFTDGSQNEEKLPDIRYVRDS